MAFLQPENIAGRNDVPARLQQVARALRDDLPEEVTVWLERTGDGETAALAREFDPQGTTTAGAPSEPYLVVLDPTGGIAVLETPSVTRVRRHLLRNRRIEVEPLREEIARRAERLRRGLQAGAVRSLPVVHVLALPQRRREDLPTQLSLQVLTAEDFAPDSLRPALQRVMGRPVAPLNSAQETGVRATVKPEILIEDAAQQGTAEQRPLFGPPDDAGTIRALGRRQERLARHLGGGYRLIRGVAGSGKTLILTHRAKHIGQHLPRWRILLLCYNRALARALAQDVDGVENVEVRTVDSLAYRLLYGVRRINPGDRQPDYAARRREALGVAQDLGDWKRFDMVLVDEAQDLDSSGLNLAWAMLKADRDHFVIALDSAQNLYRRRMVWNPPNMTARGRSTVLTVNYRNTREILDLAQGALQGLEAAASRDPQSDHLDVFIEPEAAARHGPLPKTYVCADLAGEVRSIAERIRQLRQAGAEPEQIVVLSGSRELRTAVMAAVPEAFDVKRDSNSAIAVHNRVRVATLHWPKGLEFRHVIVGGANKISVEADDETAQEQQQRRLLYVGMTRATETLTVTCSGDGPMRQIQELQLRNMGTPWA